MRDYVEFEIDSAKMSLEKNTNSFKVWFESFASEVAAVGKKIEGGEFDAVDAIRMLQSRLTGLLPDAERINSSRKMIRVLEQVKKMSEK